MAMTVDARKRALAGKSTRATVRRKAGPYGIQLLISRCREKPLRRTKGTVPQTDTGRRGEYPKALKRTLVQELGKLTP